MKTEDIRLELTLNDIKQVCFYVYHIFSRVGFLIVLVMH